jgi:acyl carrier protein
MNREKILEIMSIIFEMEKNDLVGKVSSIEIKEWDSMRHFQLILAIEKEYNIEFTPDQVRKAVNLTSILNILGNTDT